MEQHIVVTIILCLLSRSDLVLTEDEVLISKAAIKLLRPFEVVTREMSGEQYISSSKIVILVRSLQENILRNQDE